MKTFECQTNLPLTELKILESSTDRSELIMGDSYIIPRRRKIIQLPAGVLGGRIHQVLARRFNPRILIDEN